jgi:hypothetical protein
MTALKTPWKYLGDKPTLHAKLSRVRTPPAASISSQAFRTAFLCPA